MESAGESVEPETAVDETEVTPTLEGLHGKPQALGFTLPDPIVRPNAAAEADAESKRLSFSSLYSLGSAIYSSARATGLSASSSIAGSEPEGTDTVGIRVRPRTDLSHSWTGDDRDVFLIGHGCDPEWQFQSVPAKRRYAL